MAMVRWLGLTLLLAILPAQASSPSGEGIRWQDWTKEAFEQAKREGRFLILDLEAVWCHWCHVMEETTYQDPEVVKLIGEHYVALRVDQDSRPDLSNRYKEYGWPATIFFTPDGTEIVKRSGYIAPEPMARLLQAIVDDPSPEAAAALQLPEKAADGGYLSAELRKALVQRHKDSLDRRVGGLDIAMKYLERDSVEYALRLAEAGDEQEDAWARLTVDASLALLDPAWGGAYQYSTHGDWSHVHFEKIMAVQAGYIRSYVDAWQRWGEERHLVAARSIIAYLESFLSAPDGGFYTSQDADLVQGEHSEEYFALADAERRKQGVPRVDTHEYARETGWAAEALGRFYEASGETAQLNRAVRAARWAIGHRSLPGGGFRHDAEDVAGPYLGDTLSMGRAFLQLYRATADGEWLDRARKAAEFIDNHFRAKPAGWASAQADDSPVPPLPQIDENMSLTRFVNLLYHYTGEKRYREMAEHGMRWLATETIATSRLTEAGILLADREMAEDPTHLTVIGAKSDGAAKALYDTARQVQGWYKRIEWWDTAEGPLPNPDVQYPVLPRAAAFVCTNQRCSLPLFTSKAVTDLLARLQGKDHT